MSTLDADNTLGLSAILSSFRSGIKEEQAWSLIYQSIVTTKQIDNNSYAEPQDLFITSDGYIHEKTLRSICEANVSIDKMWYKIALIIYKALDYGLEPDEEVRLSNDLHQFFDQRLDYDDEGIEPEELSLDSIEAKCCSRITDETITDIGHHYRNVCRALVAEALDLSKFLRQVSIGNQELNKIRNDPNNEIELDIEVWAHVWMKVMNELRFNCTLKKLNKVELMERQQKEYELTPFEMLLDDINSKRYQLKKVSEAKKVEKDAETVILDYIKSRPTLRPATERQLRPLPENQPSLHQLLMNGIHSRPKLRPSPKPFERKFDSLRLPRRTAFSIYTKSVVIQPQAETNTNGGQFQRLNFRNMSLRNHIFSPPKSPTNNAAAEEANPNANQTPSNSFWRRWFRW